MPAPLWDGAATVVPINISKNAAYLKVSPTKPATYPGPPRAAGSPIFISIAREAESTTATL